MKHPQEMTITSKEILGDQTSLSITFFFLGRSELAYNFISFFKLVFPNNVFCPLPFALDIYNAVLNVKDETPKIDCNISKDQFSLE